MCKACPELPVQASIIDAGGIGHWLMQFAPAAVVGIAVGNTTHPCPVETYLGERYRPRRFMVLSEETVEYGQDGHSILHPAARFQNDDWVRALLKRIDARCNGASPQVHPVAVTAGQMLADLLDVLAEDGSAMAPR